ncbi:helix-turn-helix domain-containing protein [Sporosarcina siberiensis]|uniref:Helix-turn-helix domain-containing protein n=1 Tax=Sporosarcina siberiensis TaxID=1365606 RepID=A0ABW4SIZ2_9BACL
MNSENGVPFYLIQTIYSLRLKSGMNPSELANKIGVTLEEYEGWERDSSDISYEHILKLEEVFQIPSRYIFFGSDITLYNTQRNEPK